jgi:tRNA dimethylallyltransferase
MSKPKILIIVGPTASGKTALSIELAQKFNGEIISADSRQVYCGLDLGTGKVTHEEMQNIKHHLLDVADPSDVYTSAEFVRDGRNAIGEILKEKKLPIIAGGTFFYIDALLGKVEMPEVPPNPELRAKLDKMSVESLYGALEKSDPRRADEIDPQNKRRLIRALEVVEALGKVPKHTTESKYEVLTVGIKTDKKELYRKIKKRLKKRMAAGMIDEVKALHKKGMTYERMEELGLEYRYIARFLKEKISEKEMLGEIETKTRQFAKRQLTWLKRDKTIKWFPLEEKDEIFKAVSNFIQK